MTTLIPESAHIETFVLSAERADCSGDHNAKAHAALTARLALELGAGNVFAVLQCEGRYKGASERSLAVIAPQGWFTTAYDLGREYGQESILQIFPTGAGQLTFMDSRESEAVGHYSYVDTMNTKGMDAYTIVLGTGHAFTFI